MGCTERDFLKHGDIVTMNGKRFDNVTFSTYTCPTHIHRLYAPGMLSALVASHKCEFGEIILVRQRCKDIDVGMPEIECHVLETENYPNIYKDFNIIENNPLADKHSGHNGPLDQFTPSEDLKYWWKYHTNQLIVLKEAHTDYIVFSDDDAPLLGDDPEYSWVERGIKELIHNKQLIMVSAGHGLNGTWGNDEIHTIMSLQVCIINRERFLSMDYETPLPPGIDWWSYHFMLEGRIWRYAMKHDLRRLILGRPVIGHLEW